MQEEQLWMDIHMHEISISCIDALNYTPTIDALRKTINTIKEKVHIKTVYWFSDCPFYSKLDVDCNIRWIKIPKFKRYTLEYNYITLKLMPHICTEKQNMIIHADGFAINKESWYNEFLDYDYIGAVWPNGQVGNGGFTIRSRKLYDAMLDMDMYYQETFIRHTIIDNPDFYVFDGHGDKVIPEDNIICKLYRNELEFKYNINFAPPHIADMFSIEHNMSSPWVGKSLGFHGKHGIAKHYGVNL